MNFLYIVLLCYLYNGDLIWYMFALFEKQHDRRQKARRSVRTADNKEIIRFTLSLFFYIYIERQGKDEKWKKARFTL